MPEIVNFPGPEKFRVNPLGFGRKYEVETRK
jgi:hypothetical protein